VSRLVHGRAGVEDEQLCDPDQALQASVVVARLIPRLGVRLDAEYGAEAEQRGAIPADAKLVIDQRHREELQAVSQLRPVLDEGALESHVPRLGSGLL
jgi:hypothetical protein